MQGAYTPVDYWVYVPKGILCEESQCYTWAMFQIMLNKQHELIDSGEYELELPWENYEDSNL